MQQEGLMMCCFKEDDFSRSLVKADLASKTPGTAAVLGGATARYQLPPGRMGGTHFTGSREYHISDLCCWKALLASAGAANQSNIFANANKSIVVAPQHHRRPCNLAAKRTKSEAYLQSTFSV
jgi:hypothetical protein